jgi:hypothetical protein
MFEYLLRSCIFYFLINALPAITAIKKSTIKTKNKILAMDAAPAAMPVNPNIAATIATIKNMSAQRNMILSFKG